MREGFKDSEHLLRLALLFAGGTLLFLLVRALLVPAGFGSLGFFRPGALDDNMSRPVVFAGRAACAECHGEVDEVLSGDGHAGLSCEACHGALGAHAADPDANVPELPANVTPTCERCHEANQARPAKHPQIDVKAHAEGAACTDCHDQHSPSM